MKMKIMCRSISTAIWREKQLAIVKLLRRARIVTDPGRLAYLKAEVIKQNIASESDAPRFDVSAKVRLR